MNSIEEEQIIHWAKKHNPRPQFPNIDCSIDSYFSPYCDDIVYDDLHFSSIPELKNHFDTTSNPDSPLHEISLICAIAAFKNRPDSLCTKDKHLYALSDYIYVF